MKKFIILIAFSVWACDIGISQCPSSAITLGSQAEVDAFPTTYQGCSVIPVSVTITGNDITNLDGLSMVTGTERSFFIRDNPQLTSINGLSNVTFIDVELLFENNPLLTSLAGLDNLTSLGGFLDIESNASLATLNGLGPIPSTGSYVYIAFNPLLTDISALSNIQTIGLGFPSGSLTISHNNSLTSINGLNALTYVEGFCAIGSNSALTSLSGLSNLQTVNGNFELTNNVALTSLNGLESLNSIGGELAITNEFSLTSLSALGSLTIGGDLGIASNPLLSDCAAQGICDYLANPSGNITISGNAQGCQNLIQVEMACGLLPVELIAFDGREESDGVLLSWTTASEFDNAYFQIEHSTDGIDFQAIGKVAGKGTRASLSNYSFIDHQPSTGINYYLLKEVDTDGQYEYSRIISVYLKTDDVIIAPNPAHDMISITAPEPEAVVRLLDFTGTLIRTWTLADSRFADLSGLPKGMYYIEIQTGNRKVVKKIIRE